MLSFFILFSHWLEGSHNDGSSNNHLGPQGNLGNVENFHGRRILIPWPEHYARPGLIISKSFELWRKETFVLVTRVSTSVPCTDPNELTLLLQLTLVIVYCLCLFQVTVIENSIQTGLNNKKKNTSAYKTAKLWGSPGFRQNSINISYSVTGDQVSLPCSSPGFQLHFQFPYVVSFAASATLRELVRKVEAV